MNYENKGKIFVYTVVKPTATKISEVVNGKTNKKLNQMKISKGCLNTFQVGYSGSKKRLSTGLDRMVPNPFYENEEINLGEFKDLLDPSKKEVKLQHYKEYQWGKQPHYLTDEPFVRGTSDPQKPTFFQKFVFKCNDGLTVFDRSKMNDDLAYYVMIDSKHFANSKKELDTHLWPEAKHYIGQEQEDEEIKFKKRYLRDSAKAALTNGLVNTPEMRLKFLRILLPDSSRSTMSETQVYNVLSDAIDRNERGSDLVTFIEKFNDLLILLDSSEGRERFEAMDFLQRLVNAWIIVESKGTYTWKTKQIEIGQSKAGAISFLLNPKKQEMHDLLEEELTAKTR